MTNEDRIEVMGMIQDALYQVWKDINQLPEVENALDNAIRRLYSQIEDLENEHN